MPRKSTQSLHPSAAVGVFFVDPHGSDQWTGQLPQVDAGKSNGPFRNIERALQAAVGLKKQQGGTWAQPVSIFVRGGNYYLSQPIVLRPEHSGTESCTLSVVAYGNEKPIVSSGQAITQWKTVTIEERELWCAELPEVRDRNWFFHQLWVNGERRTRARHPNSGYLQIANLLDAAPTWESGHKRFQFKAGDLKAWPSARDGDVVAMTRWVESRLPILEIDEKQNLVTSSKRSVFQLQPGDLYYVEHIFEALDQPGEWFLNREKGILYYYPLPTEKLAGFEAVAPRLVDCLRMEGDPGNGKFVEHVEVRGLTFANNEWYFPNNFGNAERHISTTPDPDIYGFAQAAFGVPGAIWLEGARYCGFEQCNFVNIGSYGMQMSRGCQSNVIRSCNFSDLAAGGIRLGETLMRTNLLEQTYGNDIVDCSLLDGGKMFHSGEGIWIGQSYGNRLSHNTIADFYYSGISIGWTWGYEASFASNNIVEFNHVHHIGQKSNGDGPILSDMGGLYTLGTQPGTVIRNNFWNDIHGLRYGGWGIYFDEGSSGIVAENNVVIGTTHGGFHQHYGKENVVRNNVFALARDWQLQRTRAEGHSSFTFEKNIVLFDSGKLLEGDWSGGKLRQDNNLYFDLRPTTTNLNFPGGWDAWRKTGRDVHSLLANPRLLSTNMSEFKIAQDSPAARLGFQEIDCSNIGPRHQQAP